jgi:hypothetical protein
LFGLGIVVSLKVAYSKMVGHQRTAFLVEIIAYITGRVTMADLSWAEGEYTDEDWER